MCCIAQAAFAIIDANEATNAIELLGTLTNLGYCVTDSILATRDAVHAGLVAA